MSELIAQITQGQLGIILLYFPLGIIGLWRWSVWLLKEFVALRYRPSTGKYKTSVSVVTAVYNENHRVFSKALNSWAKNNPSEIVAVIDYTDKACIKAFRDFGENKKKSCRTELIITKTPGKRPALVDGARASRGEIIVLTDGDTIWEKDLLNNALQPLKDPKVGGVATRQNELEGKTLSQRLFDIQLDHRYFDEMPFLAASGHALTCLSGRTAVYRRTALLPVLDGVMHAHFWGDKV
ncbi:glycosyltransferase, partial [Patescibacteria group bacterium]|nr:glycosyltransferase [Patescibacteria group bacterium]